MSIVGVTKGYAEYFVLSRFDLVLKLVINSKTISLYDLRELPLFVQHSILTKIYSRRYSGPRIWLGMTGICPYGTATLKTTTFAT